MNSSYDESKKKFICNADAQGFIMLLFVFLNWGDHCNHNLLTTNKNGLLVFQDNKIKNQCNDVSQKLKQHFIKTNAFQFKMYKSYSSKLVSIVIDQQCRLKQKDNHK